jgi:hypothetical protein
LRRRDGDGRLWGFQRGWAEVGPRRAWAATHFHGGHYSQEDISVTVGEDVACLVCLERSARNASDGQPLPIMELRVTQTFRLEATGGASSTAMPTNWCKNANPPKSIQAVGATHQWNATTRLSVIYSQKSQNADSGKKGRAFRHCFSRFPTC